MTRRVLLAMLAVAAAAWWAVPPPSVVGESLRIGAQAPEIAGGPWIGSPPLTLGGLRGRVVLVEFWTYG